MLCMGRERACFYLENEKGGKHHNTEVRVMAQVSHVAEKVMKS